MTNSDFDLDLSSIDPEDIDLREIDFPPTIQWRGVTLKRTNAYLDLEYEGAQGEFWIQVLREFSASPKPSWGGWEAATVFYKKEYKAEGDTYEQALDRLMDKWLDDNEDWVKVALKK